MRTCDCNKFTIKARGHICALKQGGELHAKMDNENAWFLQSVNVHHAEVHNIGVNPYIVAQNLNLLLPIEFARSQGGVVGISCR